MQVVYAVEQERNLRKLLGAEQRSLRDRGLVRIAILDGQYSVRVLYISGARAVLIGLNITRGSVRARLFNHRRRRRIDAFSKWLDECICRRAEDCHSQHWASTSPQNHIKAIFS